MTTAPPLPTRSGTVLDPFAVLDLPPDPDLTDDQVHTAWQHQLASTNERTDTADESASITSAYEALRSAVRRAEALDSLYAYWDQNDRASAPQNTSSGAPGHDAVLSTSALERSPGGQSASSSTGSDPEVGTRWAAELSRMPRPRQPEERLDDIVPSPERREELRRIVAEQRRKQGLPPVIQDEATIAKVVDILLGIQAGSEERQYSNASDSGAAQFERAGSATARMPRQRNRLFTRIRHGRPLWLVARVLIAIAIPVSAYLAQPDYPSWIALAVGSLTWLGFTARYDLAPANRT